MTHLRDLVIGPLNIDHDRASFHCNVDALDNYIHKQAGQDIKRSISRVFVAEQPGNSKEVMGYYSLSTLSIVLSQLPENLARKLPRHSGQSQISIIVKSWPLSRQRKKHTLPPNNTNKPS